MLGKRAGSAHQLVVRDYSIDQPDSLRFRSRDHLSGEDQFFRFTVTDQFDQPRAAAGPGDQPDVVFSKAELSLVRCYANVARESYLQAGAGAGPVDRREHRLLDQLELVEELCKAMVLRAELRGAPLSLEVTDITTRREGATRSGEDDYGDFFVGLKLREELREVITHFFVDGVETIWTVERDRRDAIGQFESDGFVGHDTFAQDDAKVTW